MTLLNAYLFQIIQNPSNLENELNAAGPGTSPFQLTNMMDFLSKGLNWAIIFGALIIFFCILFSGVQWMMAGGDKNNVQQAKSRLTSCLIGFAVLALTYAVAMVLQFFFGINIIQAPGGSFTAYEPPAQIATAPPKELPPATSGGGEIPGSGPVAPTATGTPTNTPTPRPQVPTPTPLPIGGNGIIYKLDTAAKAPDWQIPNSGNAPIDLNAILTDTDGDQFVPNKGCGTGAYKFNGSGGAIRSNPDTTSNPQFENAKNFAISAWINPEVELGRTQDDVILTVNNAYGLRYTKEGKVEGWIEVAIPQQPGRSSKIRLKSPTTINPGTWYHTALIFNESDQTLRLYINGTEVLQTSNIAGPYLREGATPCPITIGTNCVGTNYADDFRGYIDEVSVQIHNEPTSSRWFQPEDIRSTCEPK